ncbi:RNA-binding protein [Micrococcus luteus]|uniref:RNA-binding protein n=1 Tax=Micrococcus luteus TaxID=1270 RepID=UPI0029DD7261|nr:RNA-binding protein [Micrococcus luteus]
MSGTGPTTRTPPAAATAPPMFWRAEDLPAWQRWQRAQWPASRRAVDRARTAARAGRSLLRRGGAAAPEAGLTLLLPPGDLHSLVALESAGPTQWAALAAPVLALAEGRSRLPAVFEPGSAAELAARRMLRDGTAWLLPAAVADAVRDRLPWGAALTPVPAVDAALAERLAGLRRVLVAGEYLPAGRAAVRWARERGARVGVVQHGLLAVSTPPVPRDVTLYAFTARDAGWWTQGRADVRAVAVGSALLEDARRAAPSAPPAGSPPAAAPGPGVFLGQLHGAELPRADFARAAQEYIRATGAVYRPHPAEQDRLSRAQHARWEAAGITVDRSGAPLTETFGPVAAVFSTGILEAAQAGRPAWGVHPDPPAWLTEFWDRYGIVRWTPGAGADSAPPAPTPPLASPTADPAAAIAEHVWKESA